jgi:hypothetical protein
MMQDVVCSHCGDNWEAFFLREDADEDFGKCPDPSGWFKITLSGYGCPTCGVQKSIGEFYNIEQMFDTSIFDGDPVDFF